MPAQILLIEDNPANLELMGYLLRAFGYEPHATVDGAAGLEAVRNGSFDLVICDIQMPVMDGYEVARRLKADPVLRNIPLVAVTALAMVGDRDRVLAAGFDGYLAKPIDPETFVKRVEEFLRPEIRTSTPRHVSVATASPNYTSAGYKILVVDNLPVNLDLARSILEPHGYQVMTAAGMDAGLTLAHETPFDLILSDVCMSGGSGYDFIRRIKADPILADIPFVFLTSTMTDEKSRTLGLALGAARFLFRPIEPEMLLTELQACLREAGKG